MEYYLIKTERANHAKDLITGLDADKWDSIDGFISVGGDGLFNEVIVTRTRHSCTWWGGGGWRF